MSRLPVAVLLLSSLWLSACGEPARERAQAALRAADAAVLDLDPDVERLAPNEVRAARVARDVALAAARRDDWKGAREIAGSVPDRVRAAVEIASTRRAAVARAWAHAKVDVPNLLFALEDRLDALDELRRLPPGLDRRALAAARAELDAARAEWERLAPAADAVGAAPGVDRAEALEARLAAAIHKVGVP